jgi:hypothetical protein
MKTASIPEIRDAETRAISRRMARYGRMSPEYREGLNVVAEVCRLFSWGYADGSEGEPHGASIKAEILNAKQAAAYDIGYEIGAERRRIKEGLS